MAKFNFSRDRIELRADFPPLCPASLEALRTLLSLTLTHCATKCHAGIARQTAVDEPLDSMYVSALRKSVRHTPRHPEVYKQDTPLSCIMYVCAILTFSLRIAKEMFMTSSRLNVGPLRATCGGIYKLVTVTPSRLVLLLIHRLPIRHSAHDVEARNAQQLRLKLPAPPPPAHRAHQAPRRGLLSRCATPLPHLARTRR